MDHSLLLFTPHLEQQQMVLWREKLNQVSLMRTMGWSLSIYSWELFLALSLPWKKRPQKILTWVGKWVWPDTVTDRVTLKIKAKLVTISEQDETHESLQEGQWSHAVFAQLLHLGLCVILLSNKGSSLLLLAVVVLVSVVVLMTYTCSSLGKGNSWPCDHPVHNCNTLFFICTTLWSHCWAVLCATGWWQGGGHGQGRFRRWSTNWADSQSAQ